MKKQHELITIIIPAYNAERYLAACVESALAQTYRELEIILVDDGSTDATPALCDAFAARDARVRVVHQENRGLSGARNTGLDIASSGYYMFLDADDEMRPEMAETLWDLLHATDADIAECGFVYSRSDAEDQSECADSGEVPYSSKTCTGEEKFLHILQDDVGSIVQWNKLYKKHIFDTIRYPLGKIHEDEFVIHHEVNAAKKVAVTDQKLYVYRQHADSLTANPSAKSLLHAFEAFADRIDFFCAQGREDLAVECFFWIEYERYLMQKIDKKIVSEDAETWAAVKKIYRRLLWKIASLPGGKRHVLRCVRGAVVERLQKRLTGKADE